MTTKPDTGSTLPADEWTDPDDAPELTAEFFADAEMFKGDTFIKRGRGRPATGNAKEQVSIRLDRDVLAKLREAGPGWQSQVNALLRAGLHLDQPAPAPAPVPPLHGQVLAGLPHVIPTGLGAAAYLYAGIGAVPTDKGIFEMVHSPWLMTFKNKL